MIVGHVFGTTRQWGHDTFPMRGLQGAAEFSLCTLVCNLMSVGQLLARLRQPAVN